MSSINEILHQMQKTINAPKSQFNSFGKYYFRNVEDILFGVKEVLPIGYYVTVSDELVFMGDRYYIKATASLHAGNACISASAYAREELTKKGMDSSQITGSASSYARKYALGGLFCIDDSKIEASPDIDSSYHSHITHKFSNEEMSELSDIETVFNECPDIESLKNRYIEFSKAYKDNKFMKEEVTRLKDVYKLKKEGK